VTWRTLEHFRLPRGRTAAAFAAHDSGGVTIFAVISFAMLMMMVGLVVDVGRVMNVHSQVNFYADRVALAAAAQLDGRPGALTRAKDAALGIVEGLRFSLSGDTDIGIEKLTFLSRLGADPSDPFARSPVDGDEVVATWVAGEGGGGSFTPSIAETDTFANGAATYVIVDTTDETEEFIFFPLLAALTPGPALENATVAPQAVARFERSMCNIAPLMVCNPVEDVAGASFSPLTEKGRMIVARLHGPSSGPWGPGTYSVMRPTSFSLNWSRSNLQRYMGRISQNIGCFGSSVIVERNDAGNFTDRRRGINEGLNVRFDMYHGAMYDHHDEANYAPAPNVLKGLLTDEDDGSGSACENDVSANTIPFPRDPIWNRMTYWNTNFRPTLGTGPPLALHDEGSTPYLAATRYQIYREEIEHSPPGRMHPPGTNEDDEPQDDLNHEYGTKSCWHLTQDPAPRSPPHPDSNPIRDRRVLPVAVVNCLEHAAILAVEDDNQRIVPVETYAEMFLTEPAGDPRSSGGTPLGDQIYLEVIGPVRSALPDEVLREFSVLSR
jgi:hypothetical protein